SSGHVAVVDEGLALQRGLLGITVSSRDAANELREFLASADGAELLKLAKGGRVIPRLTGGSLRAIVLPNDWRDRARDLGNGDLAERLEAALDDASDSR